MIVGSNGTKTDRLFIIFKTFSCLLKVALLLEALPLQVPLQNLLQEGVAPLGPQENTVVLTQHLDGKYNWRHQRRSVLKIQLSQSSQKICQNQSVSQSVTLSSRSFVCPLERLLSPGVWIWVSHLFMLHQWLWWGCSSHTPADLCLYSYVVTIIMMVKWWLSLLLLQIVQSCRLAQSHRSTSPQTSLKSPEQLTDQDETNQMIWLDDISNWWKSSDSLVFGLGEDVATMSC